MKDTVRKIGNGNALQIAQSALVETERRVAELEIERAQKLEDAESDYLAEIDALDQQIRTLQANASVHRDRIAAMDIKAAKRERARIAEQRLTAIAERKALLPARVSAAEQVDAALKQLADAFAGLETADNALFAAWPDILPSPHRFTYLSALRIGELAAGRRQRMTAGAVRHLVERVPLEIAAEVEKRNRELLEELEGVTMIKNTEPEDIVA
jgi:hypothetical protein